MDAETTLASIDFLRSQMPEEQLIDEIESMDKSAVNFSRHHYNARIADLVYGPAQLSGPIEGPRKLVWWDSGVGCERAPDFLGSLDASIPGEKIVEIKRLLDDTWLARACSDRLSQFGSGSTEAIARRAAALRIFLATRSQSS